MVNTITHLHEVTLLSSLPKGILGNLKSGKSALVNKYITGSYVALEKPDGEKKQVLLHNVSHVLLLMMCVVVRRPVQEGSSGGRAESPVTDPRRVRLARRTGTCVCLRVCCSIVVVWDANLLTVARVPLQFCSWVDAVILVFSLENEASFQELYQLYSQLSSQRTDVPVIVVGTQGQQMKQLCVVESRAGPGPMRAQIKQGIVSYQVETCSPRTTW